MKNFLLILSLVFATSAFTKEIPLPKNVVSFKNPTLNGLSFLASDSGEYYKFDQSAPGDDGAVVVDESMRANLFCQMNGYKNAYTYTLKSLKETSNVLVVSTDLVAKPFIAYTFEAPYDGGTKVYSGTVYTNISCVKIP